MRHQTVYIDGFPISDVYGCSWTPELVDRAYIWLRNSGLIPIKQFELIPEWYPLNIIGFPNYSVSKDGRLLRNGGTNHNGTYGSSNRDSYKFSMIDPITNVRKYIQAHIVIASMFLPPIPISEQAKSKLIHIDGNPKNNRVENLKWVNSKYEQLNPIPSIPPKNKQGDNANWFSHLNIIVSTPIEPKPKENRRNRYILKQIDVNTKIIINIWSSISEAKHHLGLKDTDRSNISRAIRKKTTAVGFAWKYATESLPEEEWKVVQKYPGAKPFSVSNMGRIKTHKGRITFGYSGLYGYNIYCVKTQLPGRVMRSEPVRIDQLVYEAFHWALPAMMFIIYHKDDDVTNDKFVNLESELDLRLDDMMSDDNAENQLKILEDEGLRTNLDYYC
jgi:hypothetical protein